MGDIIAIADTNGTIVVRYTYDAWGNVTSITGSLASTIGELNPMRYRGYYLDAETGYYYLQSRYYEPSMGRFINSDDPIMLSLGKTFGTNAFAYCNNNPVMNIDPSGYFTMKTWIFSTALDIILTVLNAQLQASCTTLAVTVRLLSKSAFTFKTAQNLLVGKVIPCFIYGFLNPIATAIRTVIWRTSGVVLNFAFSKSLDLAISKIKRYNVKQFATFISSMFSWGSFIGLVLDIGTDGSLNGNIKI